MFGSMRRRGACATSQRITQLALLRKNGVAAARLASDNGGGKASQLQLQNVQVHAATTQAAAQPDAAAGVHAAAAAHVPLASVGVASAPVAPEAAAKAGKPSSSGASSDNRASSSAMGGGSTSNDNAGRGKELETSVAWWKTKPAISLLSIAGALLGVVIGSWMTGIEGPDRTDAAEAARKRQLADTAQAFSQRRVAAVKERLKRTEKATPQERAARSLGARTLLLLERSSAMAVADIIVRTAGLYMFCGPKGEGKSSLMKQVEAQNPFVIRVDLQNGSMDKAVRAVAAAMGYSLNYTAEELVARAAGVPVPEISAVQGIADFEELLMVFEQACKELSAEGALGNHVPVLILE